MSSLKDWYRYVDSRTRSRPEPERAAGGPPDRDLPEGTGAPPDPDEGSTDAAEPPGASGSAGTEEEGLDVWSSLLSPPRKPEPKPTTAPLKRPAARRDEVPPDLPFTRTPIDTPPAPQFPRPDVEVSIPSFDEFISPGPLAGSSPPTADLSSSTDSPPEQAVPLIAESTPADATPPAAHQTADAAAPGGDSAPSPSYSPVPEPAPSAGESTPETTASSSLAASSDEEALPTEEGQVPWRSPFPRPGPGRTVPAGASSPRPEPVAPRAVSSPLPAAEEGSSLGPAPARSPSRPAPGTDAWERERVERLARTFRETLRALEESLGGPGAQASSAEAPPLPTAAPTGADLTGSPAVERAPRSENAAAAVWSPPESADRGAPTLVAAPPAGRSAAPDLEQPSSREVLPQPGAAAAAEAPPDAIQEIRTEAAAPPVAEPPLLQENEALVPSTAEALAVSPSPPPASRVPGPTSPATPDVLRNIEEAALIRERLPQHIDMLLRIPTNEVAQNSYKSPFRETREELIRRLLDPQLTLEEAARVLGVCPTTVRRYTNRGMLHCHRTPGNQRRFRMSDVLQFVEQYGDRIDRAAEARQFEEAA